MKSQSEKAVVESKIKEAKRKYEVELKELELQVKNLTKINKMKEKEIHRVNKVLENARTTIKHAKSENSKLKTCKSRLEGEIRKLEKLN